MAEKVHSATDKGIATITLDNPPVNALGADLRAGLAAAVTAALNDPAVRVIVLVAAGRTWPVGADIREFAAIGAAETGPDICTLVADADKPVVAALHGTVLGGGLELALAAGVRVAEAGTMLGLPEVSLGLVPGWGGTQRLPRLIGARAALGLMLSGLPVGAARAEELGLLEAVTDGSAADIAHRLAKSFVDGDAELPTAKERAAGLRPSASDWLDAIQAARAGLGDPRLPAPGRIIDCVEAALLLPEDEGFLFERTAFAELVATPQSMALRHAFLAERRAGRLPPELARIKPRALHGVGIVGGGVRGAGLALACLGAGFEVTLYESDEAGLAAGLSRIATLHERAVEQGRLSAARRDAEWDRITGTITLEDLATVDLIIEAGPEGAATPPDRFADLGAVAKPGAIIAASTAFPEIDRVAALSGRPNDVIGIYAHGPVQSAKLIEIVEARRSAPDVVATAFGLCRQLGKITVATRAGSGSIGSRVITAFRTAMDFLLEDGASPYEIDAAMRDFGFALGPYQVLDRDGLDISWARRRRLALRRDPARRYVAIGDRLCEEERFGVRVGKGYYQYAEDRRKGREDPEVLRLIEAERQSKGIVARRVGAEEIRTRALAAMANEGARLLDEGLALCPSDIDVVMMAGYGFPRWRGGPMMAADQAGLLGLRNRLRDYSREEEAFWQPAEIWDRLIKNGDKFADMNPG